MDTSNIVDLGSRDGISDGLTSREGTAIDSDSG